MQAMYYSGLDVQKRKISYRVKDAHRHLNKVAFWSWVPTVYSLAGITVWKLPSLSTTEAEKVACDFWHRGSSNVLHYRLSQAFAATERGRSCRRVKRAGSGASAPLVALGSLPRSGDGRNFLRTIRAEPVRPQLAVPIAR